MNGISQWSSLLKFKPQSTWGNIKFYNNLICLLRWIDYLMKNVIMNVQRAKKVRIMKALFYTIVKFTFGVATFPEKKKKV